MNEIAKWTILAWLAVTALLTVSTVGKKREPRTPGEAVIGLIEIGLAATAILVWWN